MRGFSIIELIISICIIAIISLFFFDTINVFFKIHDNNLKKNEHYYSSLSLLKQMRDEITNSVSLSSNNSGNLLITTYDSNDTDILSTTTKNIVYNFINGKLYKYNENYSETVAFTTSFDTVIFEVFSSVDSAAKITITSDSGTTDVIYISKRN